MNDKFKRGVGVDTCEVGSFVSSYPVPELSLPCTYPQSIIFLFGTIFLSDGSVSFIIGEPFRRNYNTLKVIK